VQLLVAAWRPIAPASKDAFQDIPIKKSYSDAEIAENPSVLQMNFVYAIIRTLIEDLAVHSRNADEFLSLVRELSLIQSLRAAFLRMNIINFLINTVTSNNVVNKNVKNAGKQNVETYLLVPSVVEAIAAILGVPQISKAPLIVEVSDSISVSKNPFYQNSTLSPAAKEAFSQIFKESCRPNEVCMDSVDITQFLSKMGTAQKLTAAQVKAQFERYDDSHDGKVRLEVKIIAINCIIS
jgi:hypothetical protein